jgi:hypothetical protein
MAAFGESCRDCGHGLTARFDPLLPPAVQRSALRDALYWMTSSAVANSGSGIVRPRVLAVLKVDKFKLGRLLERQINRFLAFENAPGINASLVVPMGEAAAIAHQTAGQGELAVWEDRGQRMPGRKRRELFGLRTGLTSGSISLHKGRLAGRDK